MDEPTRRAWSKPELIVLVRSRPEEAVLNACKVQYQSGIGGANDYCNSAPSAGQCKNCNSNVGS